MAVTGWGNNVTLTVEIAFSGPSIVWTDVTAYVRALNTRRGFQHQSGRWNTGAGSMVLNNRDGRFSPWNASSPHVGYVTPWRPVRVRATYSATTYYLFYGYVTNWLEQYPGQLDNTITVTFADEFAKIAGYVVAPQAQTGYGEFSGARLSRILGLAGVSAAQSFDQGTSTLGYYGYSSSALATAQARNAISDIDLTVDSEAGWFYCDADGTLIFDQRTSPVEKARMMTSQVTFGDSGSEVRYTDIQAAYDGLDVLTNSVSLARVNGKAQTASDSTSQGLYGVRQYARADLINESDTQVSSLAAFFMAARKDPKLRIQSAKFMPMGNPSVLFPQVLGRKIRDRVTVKRRPTGGYTVTQESQIEGVSHNITPEAWETVFDFVDYGIYSAFTPALWDSGLWDSGLWFY